MFSKIDCSAFWAFVKLSHTKFALFLDDEEVSPVSNIQNLHITSKRHNLTFAAT